MAHVLFSLFALLSSLGVRHSGFETRNIVVALLGVPLLPALFASKTKLLVLVFPLSTGAEESKGKPEEFRENMTEAKEEKSRGEKLYPFLFTALLGPPEELLPIFWSPSKKSSLSDIPGIRKCKRMHQIWHLTITKYISWPQKQNPSPHLSGISLQQTS